MLCAVLCAVLRNTHSLVAREALKCVSTVINGCLVSWRSFGSANSGYIRAWPDKNLSNWDSGIERKAGSVDISVSWSNQHFVLTSFSSLMALIAAVVFQFKTTGTIDQFLCRAFTSIRVLLLMDATRDEILATALVARQLRFTTHGRGLWASGYVLMV